MNIKMESLKVNVAPTSDKGHYVEHAKKVIQLDEVTEAFFVEGESVLTTANHTTLEMQDSCLINCQVVYDPFAKMYERSRD
jgi:hypothetical protein